MIQKRDYSISAIRCIAMCFIVSCHLMQYYNIELAWWFNVGVQIFFFISGFLYSGKFIENPITWIGMRFKKILVPYYIFLSISFIIYMIFVPNISFKNYIGSLFCISTLKGIEHLWFIKYILFCYLITPYLYYLKLWLDTKSIKNALCHLIAIWSIYVIVSIQIYNYFNPIWISCYILGYFYGVFSKRITTQRLQLVNFVGVFSALVLNSFRIYLKYVSSIQLTGIFEKLFGVFGNISHMMLGFALYVVFRRIFQNIHDNKILSFSDKYSYDIYIVHQLFILSPFTLMNITSYNCLNLVIVLISIIIYGIILHKTNLFISRRIKTEHC